MTTAQARAAELIAYDEFCNREALAALAMTSMERDYDIEYAAEQAWYRSLSPAERAENDAAVAVSQEAHRAAMYTAADLVDCPF